MQCWSGNFNVPGDGMHSETGMNATHYDGHVEWLALNPTIAATWTSGTQRTYGNRWQAAGGGYWPWASYHLGE